MRTTNKKFKEQVVKHIKYILSTDETEVLKEQLQNTMNAFNDWYSPYEQKVTPNRYDAFKHWLLGLPNEMNIEYYHDDIKAKLTEWYKACEEEYKQEDVSKFREHYYHLVIREFVNLCKMNEVSFF